MNKVIIIGGGPGGYAAALKAAILGAQVILIEKEMVGGTCLNRGCIPTKALLNSMEVLDCVRESGAFGISSSDVEASFEEIVARKDALVKQLTGGVGYLLQKRGVQVVYGKAKLLGKNLVSVERPDGSQDRIESDSIIVATGSEPMVPLQLQYDGKLVITSDEALKFTEIPSSMIIIGGGVIGCEFGQFFQKMGSQVTIVELMEHLLPPEEPEVARLLTQTLKKQGINVFTGISAEQVEKTNDSVKVKLSTGEEIEAAKMLVSVGRRAVTADLGLEEAGIRLQRGKVPVNKRMQTEVEGIYAIGDIVDTPQLAHVATREGVVAAENIMGRDSVTSYHAVPRCVYTSPEIGCVGMTEVEAQKKGISCKTGVFRFGELGKAMVMGKVTGFVKIVTNSDDQIIGASIIGSHATDMIAELTTAVHLRLTSKEAGEVIHPHPTLSEAVMEALHCVHKESIHTSR